jgi:hypothetical protein
MEQLPKHRVQPARWAGYSVTEGDLLVTETIELVGGIRDIRQMVCIVLFWFKHCVEELADCYGVVTYKVAVNQSVMCYLGFKKYSPFIFVLVQKVNTP